MLPGKSARNSRRPTERDAQKERTRQRIYDAARELFLKDGYINTRTADIAHRAGVSHGCVHSHFKTKAHILVAMMAEYFTEIDEQLGEETPSGDPVATLKTTVTRLIKAHQDNLEQVRWYYGYAWLWEAEEEAVYRKHKENIEHRLSEILHDGVRRGLLQPETPVDLIVDLVRAQYRMYLRRLRHEPASSAALERRLADSVDVLLGQYRA